MRDFDKHFNDVSGIIERAHKRTRFWAPIIILFNLAVAAVVLGFVGWVIVKLMSHFGVL